MLLDLPKCSSCHESSSIINSAIKGSQRMRQPIPDAPWGSCGQWTSRPHPRRAQEFIFGMVGVHFSSKLTIYWTLTLPPATFWVPLVGNLGPTTKPWACEAHRSLSRPQSRLRGQQALFCGRLRSSRPMISSYASPLGLPLSQMELTRGPPSFKWSGSVRVKCWRRIVIFSAV